MANKENQPPLLLNGKNAIRQHWQQQRQQQQQQPCKNDSQNKGKLEAPSHSCTDAADIWVSMQPRKRNDEPTDEELTEADMREVAVWHSRHKTRPIRYGSITSGGGAITYYGAGFESQSFCECGLYLSVCRSFKAKVDRADKLLAAKREKQTHKITGEE